MKFTGFIKEYDINIRNGRKLSEIFDETFVLDEVLKKKIVSYLETGNFVSGIMAFLYDINEKPMGNQDYFTDGTYIWPSYFKYYLTNYDNFIVDQDFINHLLKKDFRIEKLSNREIDEIDEILTKEWMGKY